MWFACLLFYIPFSSISSICLLSFSFWVWKGVWPLFCLCLFSTNRTFVFTFQEDYMSRLKTCSDLQFVPTGKLMVSLTCSYSENVLNLRHLGDIQITYSWWRHCTCAVTLRTHWMCPECRAPCHNDDSHAHVRSDVIPAWPFKLPESTNLEGRLGKDGRTSTSGSATLEGFIFKVSLP